MTYLIAFNYFFPYPLLNSSIIKFKVHPFFLCSFFQPSLTAFYDRNGQLKPYYSINNAIGDIKGK